MQPLHSNPLADIFPSTEELYSRSDRPHKPFRLKQGARRRRSDISKVCNQPAKITFVTFVSRASSVFAVAKQNAHGMQRLSARIQKLETNESRGLSGVCTFSGFIHIISCFFAHGMDLQLGLSSPFLLREITRYFAKSYQHRYSCSIIRYSYYRSRRPNTYVYYLTQF